MRKPPGRTGVSFVIAFGRDGVVKEKELFGREFAEGPVSTTVMSSEHKHVKTVTKIIIKIYVVKEKGGKKQKEKAVIKSMKGEKRE